MSSGKFGKRYPLLLYKRAMGRLWEATLFLGILLSGLWWQLTSGRVPIIETNQTTLILVGAVVTLGFSLFTFLARYMTYIQPCRDHLRLVTPFLRLQISYRRIRSVHPTNFSKLFPPHEGSWAQEQFLEPFFGMTAVVVDLTSYPLNRWLLRLFLARQMLMRQNPGFVFLVDNWMALSNEIDTSIEAWRRSRQPKRKLVTPFGKSW